MENLEITKEIMPGLVYSPALTRIKHSFIARIFSPVELLAVDMDTGERTGKLVHEEYEEIPFSLSHKEQERVLLYFDAYPDERNIVYYIKGVEDIFDLEEDKFGLRIDYRYEDEIVDSVELKNMPIVAGMAYRVRVDWENLSDTRGVFIEVDEDGDEEFEIRFELGRVIDSANPREIRLGILKKLEALKGESRINDAKIDTVAGFIRESLNPEFWENDYYLNTASGDNVFKRDLDAIRNLRLFLGFDSIMQNDYVPGFVQERFVLNLETADVFTQALSGLLRSDVLLARIALNDFSDNQEDKILNIAENKIDKAESVSENNEIQGLQLFRQVWRLVTNAAIGL
jgi:hypothetical protein